MKRPCSPVVQVLDNRQQSRFSGAVRKSRPRGSSRLPLNDKLLVVVQNLPSGASKNDIESLLTDLPLGSGKLVSANIVSDSTGNSSISAVKFKFLSREASLEAVGVFRQTKFRGHWLDSYVVRANDSGRTAEKDAIVDNSTEMCDKVAQQAVTRMSPPDNESEHAASSPAIIKLAPTLELSGALGQLRSSNFCNSFYNEPNDFARPDGMNLWRFYVFDNGHLLDDESSGIYLLNTRSCYVFGRDTTAAHISLHHRSCSKQHAVLQFRRTRPCGASQGRICPYFFDLDSRNGSFLNHERLPGRRYVELRSGDLLTFGQSTLEWIVLRESASRW